jgi:hypothetical protein
MADVFISYANEDRERAARLAEALGAHGWSVWWDRRIIAGQAFDHAIERELDNAKCVVVLWSQHSVGSEWVKNEAAVAAERGVLVPASIERVKLPLEFRRRQAADLTDWNGGTSHRGLQALCEGIASTLGSAPPHQPLPSQRAQFRSKPRWVMAVVASIALVLGVGVYLIGPWRGATPPPVSNTERSEVGPVSAGMQSPGAAAGLADLVIGTYFGDVVSDSKGSSRSDIGVTITKLDRSTVRVTSDYKRFGTVDVTLTRIGNQIFNAGGDSTFIVDLDRTPPTLAFNPRNELAYGGTKQR